MEDSAVQFEGDTESEVDVNERLFTLFGAVAAVTTVVTYGVVGYMLLESAVYGAIVGAFGGVGSYLFLPWFMGLSTVQEQSEEELGFADASQRVSSSAQMGVLDAVVEATPSPAIGRTGTLYIIQSLSAHDEFGNEYYVGRGGAAGDDADLHRPRRRVGGETRGRLD